MPDPDKTILAKRNEIIGAMNKIVKKDNVIGLQFHPEKSGEAGLKILKSFVNR